MKIFSRLICLIKRHRWSSPCAVYGDDIPPEFVPAPDAQPSEVAEKLAAYARFSCARCGKPYPKNFL